MVVLCSDVSSSLSTMAVLWSGVSLTLSDKGCYVLFWVSYTE